jgi:hypothetical protein
VILWLRVINSGQMSPRNASEEHGTRAALLALPPEAYAAV